LNDDNLKNEVAGLKLAMDTYPIGESFILIYHQNIKCEDGIIVMPAWQHLLERY
jgi:hypothetical protein